MAILNLLRTLGRRFGIKIGDHTTWAAIGDADRDFGSLEPEQAFKYSVWYAGTRLITETIATLPCSMFKRAGEDRQVARDHDMHGLLRDQPNDEQTPVEFWEGRIGPLVIDGNSYAEKKTIGDRVVQLLPMPFTDVEPFRDSDNRLKYRFMDRGRQEELPRTKVFHIRGFGLDGDKGLSPLGAARRSLQSALSVEKAAANVYRRGMRASGYFKTPPMDADQRKDFMKNYVTPFEGAQGEGGTIIMPPTIEWAAMNINPKDAEMLLSRKFSVEDVCRWLGLPPILVGHAGEGQTMWGSGIEQIILGWLVLGLRAYLKRVESAVNTHLVLPSDRRAGYFFEFNFEGLLRADSQGRAALLSQLAQNGLRTRDELRRIDNYPGGQPGGDQLTVQSNLISLGQLGQLGAQNSNANQVRDALRAWLLDAGKDAK